METKPKKTFRTKSSSNTAKMTSQLIAEQITVFLKAGGKITKIRPGDAGKRAFLDGEDT